MSQPSQQPTRYRVAQLNPRQPTAFVLAPDAEARAAIAGELPLSSLPALRFTGDDSEIDIHAPGGGKHKPEFDAWRWEALSALPELIVPFKRMVYEQVVKEFAALVPAP